MRDETGDELWLFEHCDIIPSDDDLEFFAERVAIKMESGMAEVTARAEALGLLRERLHRG